MQYILNNDQFKIISHIDKNSLVNLINGNHCKTPLTATPKIKSTRVEQINQSCATRSYARAKKKKHEIGLTQKNALKIIGHPEKVL